MKRRNDYKDKQVCLVPIWHVIIVLRYNKSRFMYNKVNQMRRLTVAQVKNSQQVTQQ